MAVDIMKLGLRLTHKEQKLLGLLASNPGQCFSRKYLLTHIWGYSEEAKSRTVDVHIRRLRKKLESFPDWKIVTVVGQGYALQRSSTYAPVMRELALSA